MKIIPFRGDLKKYIQRRNLTKKWEKATTIFEKNIRHPSLHTELLRPYWRGIYSFRLDKKHRALFFIKDGKAEIFQITNHYKK